MKHRPYKTLFLILGLLIFVSLACRSSAQADPTATPETVAEPEPVAEVTIPDPEPTITSEPIQAPQEEEEPETEPVNIDTSEDPPAFFTEEFDTDLSGWTYFLMSGDENEMDLYTDGGYLVFDLQGYDQWVYFLYEEYSYSAVRLDMLAENRAKNTNNVSMICNFSDRYGWYEFNISNGGIYNILVWSELDGTYDRLASGGSKNVRTGRDKNTYSVVCEGNYLALYVNGVLEREHTDRKYNLQDGLVGFGVSSFDVLPILVELDYFSISVP